jgi:hypothetical protein
VRPALGCSASFASFERGAGTSPGAVGVPGVARRGDRRPIGITRGCMMSMANTTVFEEFKSVVARRLELDPAGLYGRSLKLSEVVVRSPVATNSIDLMEAVAGAMAELEIDDKLELPTMTLDNTIDELMTEVADQLARA